MQMQVFYQYDQLFTALPVSQYISPCFHHKLLNVFMSATNCKNKKM